MAQTLVISINASWNIFNFRRGLILALQGAGYRVVALAPRDEYTARLADMGVEHVPLTIDSAGISPLRDLFLLHRYRQALKQLGPAIFVGYTAKPNVYGSLAAHSLGIPVVNNVSGLGTAFIRGGLLTRIVSALYRLALRRSATVFFQNPDDLELFLANGLVRASQAALLPGSGIDLSHFVAQSPDSHDDFVFLLVARLLWDKGIGEYVEAARLVREHFPNARFRILGFIDVPNRTAVPRAELDRWVSEGLIEYLGKTEDVRSHLAAADCVVLPSYREGLPRTLLEAAAMAKPLIATDVPGCRHVVEEGVNGLLCTVRDPRSLAEAMLKMLRLRPERRAEMGAAARARVEVEFDERIVADRYLAAIEAAVSPR